MRSRLFLSFATALVLPATGFSGDGKAPQAPAAEAPLSIDEAVRIGLKANPQVAAAMAGASSAMAAYRSLEVPAPISIGASRATGSSTAPSISGGSTDTFVDASWTLDTSGQRRYQAAGANASYKATHFQFLETVVSLEQQIRDAYWTLAATDAQERIARVSLDEAQHVYDLTVTQEKAGTSPHGDVIRSSIDVANAKQAILAAQATHRSALIVFNTLLAQPPQSPVMLAITLADDSMPAPVVPLAPLKQLNMAAANSRPLLKSSQEHAKAADYAVRQAEATRLPDFNVLYQRSVQNQLDALTLSISIPIFDFGGIGQTVRSAKEARNQAKAQVTQTEQQVAQQVAQAYSDVQTAVEAAGSYRKEILVPSQTLLDMAKTGYQNGATGILPVIDAEATIRNARVGYINTLLSIRKAEDALNAAVGKSSFVPHTK